MKTKKKQENSTSEETYPIYTNSGTINVTINGNGNVITFLSGQAPPPPKPPGH